MKIKRFSIILGILLFIILVTAGALDIILQNKGPTTLTTSQYEYAGTFKVMIHGEELKWIDSVKIVDREITVTAKKEVDRTYEECIEFESDSLDAECLDFDTVTYPLNNKDIINIPITKENNVFISSKSGILNKGNKLEIKYEMSLEEHYIKIGENSIQIIEDIISNADFVNVSSDLNFTYLIPTKDIPYDGLMFYYSFEDNTTGSVIYDYTDSNNDASKTGNVTFVTGGPYRQGVRLDGVDGEIVTAVGTLTDDWVAWSMWVNTDNLQQNDANHILVAGGGAAGFASFNNPGNVFFYQRKVAGVFRKIEIPFSNMIIEEGGWHQIAVNDNATGGWLYFDGVEVGSDNYGTHDGYGGTRALHFGYLNADTCNCTLDEIMFFNVSLSAEQILDIYNNQSNRFRSQGTHGLSQNISVGQGSIKVSGEFLSDVGSSINLTLYFFNGSNDWFSAGEQVYVGENLFEAGATATNITLNFTYFAGSNNGDFDFYTPSLIGENGITLDIKTKCPYAEGNWFVDQYCEYTFANENVDGNLTIQDDGIMNCTGSICNINFTSTGQYIIFENVADTENKLVGNWTINGP